MAMCEGVKQIPAIPGVSFQIGRSILYSYAYQRGYSDSSVSESEECLVLAGDGLTDKHLVRPPELGQVRILTELPNLGYTTCMKSSKTPRVAPPLLFLYPSWSG